MGWFLRSLANGSIYSSRVSAVHGGDYSQVPMCSQRQGVTIYLWDYRYTSLFPLNIDVPLNLVFSPDDRAPAYPFNIGDLSSYCPRWTPTRPRFSFCSSLPDWDVITLLLGQYPWTQFLLYYS